MKWLLISERGNPGDEWARMGVEEIIRAVDPEAKMPVIEKFSYDLNTPQPFDYAVFCGQPLVWSYEGHNTTKAGWWDALNGWIANTGKLILAGWGVYAGWKDALFTQPNIHNKPLILDKVGGLIARSRLSYCRSPVGRQIFGPSCEVHPCPSIFAVWKKVKPDNRTLRLCNFMPHGGHEPCMNSTQAKQADAIGKQVSDVLRDSGFKFVAHRQDEQVLAKKLGWPDDRIVVFNGNSAELLSIYARTERYWGNRIHGGIVASAAGADAHVCAYDTRVAAVRLVGGLVVQPSDVKVDAVKAWANGPARKPILDVEAEFMIQCNLFRYPPVKTIPYPEKAKAIDVCKPQRYTMEDEARVIIHYAMQTEGDLLEIGCSDGCLTKAIADHVAPRKVYALDYIGNEGIPTPQKEERPKVIAERALNLKNVIPVNCDSKEYVYPEGIGFFFIDGDHSPEGVKADTDKVLAYPGKKIVVWHDYRPEIAWIGVAPLLNKLASEGLPIKRITGMPICILICP